MTTQQAAGLPAPQPAADRRPARLIPAAGFLRRHWLAALLLAAGLVLRAAAQLGYRPVLFYIDSDKYLHDAGYNDPEGYKAPLRAILAVANLDAVAAVQHLLGLAMAVAVYVLLRRRGVARWLAALTIAPVLLDAYQLQQEQTVMPTVWFEALIVAGLAVLAWRDEAGWRRTALAGLILGTAPLMSQVGQALVVPAVIFVLASTRGRRPALGRAAALLVAFAVPVGGYAAGSYLTGGPFGLSHQGDTSLYGRAAAAVDCATIRLTAAERAICPTPAQQAHGDDWLSFNAQSPVQAIYRTEPRAQVDATITAFNSAVLHQQPLRLLRAYGRDAAKLYAVTRHTDPGDPPITRWQFPKNYSYFTPHATRTDVLGFTRQFGGGAPAVWRPAAGFLHRYQLDGGYAPGPLLALLTVTGLAGALLAFARRRLDARTRQLASACLLFFGSAVFLLGISDLFVYSWRYQIPALVTLVPGGVLGLAAVASLIRARRAA